MNAMTICAVLVQEHRDLSRALAALTGEARPRSSDEVGEHGRFVIDLATHLITEDVVVQPVIRDVLRRAELAAERRADIAIIVDHLDRAGRSETPEGFRRLARAAHQDFVNHAERTELGILTFVHRRFHRRDRFALGDVYRQTQATMVERFGDARPGNGEAAAPCSSALLEELRRQVEAHLDPWLPSPDGPDEVAVTADDLQIRSGGVAMRPVGPSGTS